MGSEDEKGVSKIWFLEFFQWSKEEKWSGGGRGMEG